MIDRISGILLAVETSAVVVDLGGIGFRVEVTSPCARGLGLVGDKVALLTEFKLVGQELQPRLFGFRTPEARALFRLLRGVSGIGPAVALRILGAQDTPAEVATAIARGEKAGIKVKGVGPKIASRVITELKDKVGAVLLCLPTAVNPGSSRLRPGSRDRQLEDAFLALTGLEFDPNRARSLLLEIREQLVEATADELVREVLIRA